MSAPTVPSVVMNVDLCQSHKHTHAHARRLVHYNTDNACHWMTSIICLHKGQGAPTVTFSLHPLHRHIWVVPACVTPHSRFPSRQMTHMLLRASLVFALSSSNWLFLVARSSSGMGAGAFNLCVCACMCVHVYVCMCVSASPPTAQRTFLPDVCASLYSHCRLQHSDYCHVV